MHNGLQIMVAKRNPKRIAGIDDMARADVRTSMPDPVNEGSMQFCAKKVLERHGIRQKIAADKRCVSCQTTPNNGSTAVHHRETPDRTEAGTSDAGNVWKTEILEALRAEVSYAIGALKGTPKSDAASKYLRFLMTPEAPAAYTKCGFVAASAQELALRPIP